MRDAFPVGVREERKQGRCAYWKKKKKSIGATAARTVFLVQSKHTHTLVCHARVHWRHRGNFALVRMAPTELWTSLRRRRAHIRVAVTAFVLNTCAASNTHTTIRISSPSIHFTIFLFPLFLKDFQIRILTMSVPGYFLVEKPSWGFSHQKAIRRKQRGLEKKRYKPDPNYDEIVLRKCPVE